MLKGWGDAMNLISYLLVSSIMLPFIMSKDGFLVLSFIIKGLLFVLYGKPPG